MTWQSLAEAKIVGDIGWTLAHSLWQIALVTATLFLLLRVIRPQRANIRYAVSVVALVVALAMPVTTFVRYSGHASSGSLFTANNSPERGDTDTGERAGDTTITARGAAAVSIDATGPGPTSAFLASIGTYISGTMPAVLPFMVAAWLLGVALYSIRLGGGLWQLNRFKTRGLITVGPDWRERFSSICERLEITRRIRLLSSTIVHTPIAIGHLRPVIIIPASLFLQISPLELETIIVHELIHIRRYDPLVTMVQSLIEVLFFYHPGVWWISKQIRCEREFAADLAVTHIFDDSLTVYASALANLEEIRLLADQNMPRVATAANGGNLMLRIQRILKIKTEMKHTNSAWSAGLGIVLISAVLTLVFSFNSAGVVNAISKPGDRKLAIGFVAIPPVDRGQDPPKDADATARLLIAKLGQHKVPAVGFVNGSSISDGTKLYPVRANIVRLWRDAGLEVGVGGYEHIWFSKTPYDDYVASVAKNIEVTSPLLAESKLQLRYFSYPYLNTGKSDEDHIRFEKWLQSHGLASVKYTIDNNEWMYSYAYDLARMDNDVNTMREVREAFIVYMTKMFDHYEAWSNQMFGRDIAQTMVLTSSRLVADSADDLFGMIGKRGYTFVPMAEAQADEAYKTAENFTGDSGISWFERWAMSKGMPLLDEPQTEPGIRKIWQDKKLVKAKKTKES